MSLRFALLGLLARESLTGYDLTKRFDSSVGFFWTAKHSQIYPELASLTQDGLVTFELITQTSKPNKKVYTITDQGRQALRDWVATPGDRRTVKDPLLMRTWVVGLMDPEVALQQLREAKVEYDRRGTYLNDTDLMLRDMGATETQADNPLLGMYLSAKCGLMQHEAYSQWLSWAIGQLETAIANRPASVNN